MSSQKQKSSKKADSSTNAKAKANVDRKPWSMYPALHDDVNRLLETSDLSFGFFEGDNDEGAIENHDSNIICRFKCRNKHCSKHGWKSMAVAVTIRLYPDQRYNARVYHQQCESCHRPSKPTPDESYAERIANSLKIWSGVEVDRRPYKERESERPHQSALCEGCKHGHCKFANIGIQLPLRGASSMNIGI